MKFKTIALVGQPNAGKSTLFNVLSDIKTSTSNFSGTTVAIKETFINIFGQSYHMIDLPGMYSLNPADPAEEVTLKYLLTNEIDLIINVVDATLLARSLELTVELVELGLPMVIAMNMQDEAERHGVKINAKALENELNVSVVPTTALFGKGVKQLIETCYDVIENYKLIPKELDYTYHLETGITEMVNAIGESGFIHKGNSRFYAIKAIENPSLIPMQVQDNISVLRNRIVNEIESEHKKDIFETVSYERHHLAMKLSHEISTFQHRKVRPFLEKLDDFLLHPIAGYFFLLLFFFLYFFIIFAVGSLLSMAIDIPLSMLPGIYSPLKTTFPFLWFTIDGAAMGLIGVAGVVFPYFLPLLFLTALFEETGYLARIAFLLDGIFHKIGLHGKSVVPFIMGFGCTVPAIYATRIIENKRDRVVTAMLLNFIPCSARISVIFALAVAFTGPGWAAVVFFFVVVVLAVVGKLLSSVISKPIGLILEIPTLKIPSLKISAAKTRIKLWEFLKVAMPFLILGSIVLAWIQYLKLTQYIDYALYPVVHTLLGLPEKLGTTLIFGFLRKELIIVMATQALGVKSINQLPLTVHQVVVFLIFITLYFPCVSTFVVLWKEFGRKSVLLTTLVSVVTALISATLFRIALNI